jgi:integrase
MARGSIRRRGSSWTVVLDTGRDPVTNRRRQTSRGGFKIKKEASRWLTDVQARVDQGGYVAPTRELTGTYLLGWLGAVRSSLRPSTYESYERVVRGHLIPRLGGVYLHQLGPGHLSAAYADLHATGRLDRPGGLSARSVHHVHVVLSKALTDAVAEGKLARNVAQAPTVRRRLPRPVKADLQTWTAPQLAAFCGQLRGDPLEVPILLAATTGLRRGELLGLRWADVDLDAGRLAVRQTLTAPRDPDTGPHRLVFGEPKTRRGQRSVPLPAQTVAALRGHRAAQVAERLKVGADDHDRGLVFAEPDGGPLHPDKFRERFARRVARSGLPPIRFHDLRHTYATLALQAGVHAKVVSEILGYANIGITLDTYSHAIPALQESAADTIAALVFGGA